MQGVTHKYRGVNTGSFYLCLCGFIDIDISRVVIRMEQQQVFDVPKPRKALFGEVTTPYSMINALLSQVPEELLSTANICVDVGAGYGYFGVQLKKLLEERGNQTAAVLFAEANPFHVERLAMEHGGHNVLSGDFLSHDGEYDLLVGNPPYVVDGLKKVPTATGKSKTDDGRTSWHQFVVHSLSLLREGGCLAMIVPSLWLRHDKAGIHDLLLQHQLIWMRSYGTSEANALFKGKAQTPVVSFVLVKQPTDTACRVYCDCLEDTVPICLSREMVIPTAGASLVAKFWAARGKWGGISVKKSNTLPKHAVLTPDGAHENIRTVRLTGLNPKIVIEHSMEPLPWAGVPKVVLGHKMWGLPFVDEAGQYGISNRDNYIYVGENIAELHQMRDFFEIKAVRCLFNCFRYRMRYLEKEAFAALFDPRECLPVVSEESVCEMLGLTVAEREYVCRNSGREYTRTTRN